MADVAIFDLNGDAPPVSTLRLSGRAEQGSTLMLEGTLFDSDLPGLSPSDWFVIWQVSTRPVSATDGQPLQFEALPDWLVQNQSLLLDQSFSGTIVRVLVSYFDSTQNLVVDLPPLSTAPIADRNDPPSGSVSILGTSTQGGVLEVDWIVDDIDSPNRVDEDDWTWQWYASGNLLPGETGPQLSLTQAHVGQSITAKGQYLDDQGWWNELSSLDPVIVENVDDPPIGQLKIAVRGPDGVPLTGEWVQGMTLMLVDDVQDIDGIQAGARRYQWLRDGVEIPGAVGPTLTLTQAILGSWDGHPNQLGDARISARLSYTDLGGQDESVDSWFDEAQPDYGRIRNFNDPPGGSVTVSGSAPVEGTVLSADAGTLSDPDGFDPSQVVWQWLLDGDPLDGAGGPSLLLTEWMVGRQVAVRASYVDGFGAAETNTLTLGQVANRPDPVTGAIRAEVLGGVGLRQGATLVVRHTLDDLDGMPAETEIDWEWWASAPAAQGSASPSRVGTGSELYLTQALVGWQVELRASFFDLQGNLETPPSTTIGAVLNANDPADWSGLSLKGAMLQNSRLRLEGFVLDPDRPGPIDVSGLDVRWEMVTQVPSGTSITTEVPGATGPELTLTQDMVGRAIQARLSFDDYIDEWGVPHRETYLIQTADPFSLVIDVNDPPSGRIEIVGDRQQGATLRAEPIDVYDADGPAVGPVPSSRWTWVWFAEGVEAGRGGSFLLGQQHVGQRIALQGSFIDDRSYVNTLISETSAAIANLQDEPTGSLLIRAQDEQGQLVNRAWQQGDTLVLVDTVADLDGIPLSGPNAKAYQWLRDGKPIMGANGPTLLLDQSLIGERANDGPGMMGQSTIRVQLSYTDDFGQAHRVETLEAGPFRNLNDEPTGALTVSGGPPRVGASLTVNGGSLVDQDGFDPSGLNWQWFANRVALEGETDPMLQLDESMAGQSIAVEASYTDFFGTSESFLQVLGSVESAEAVQGMVYHWKSHALLGGARVSATRVDLEGEAVAYQATSASGTGIYSLGALPVGRYRFAFGFERDAEAKSTDLEAITTADAMAALKLASGRNPNPDPDGPGPLAPAPVSPYQLIAADVNLDGEVTRDDARLILAIAMGQGGSQSLGWTLIGEGWDLWDETLAQGSGGFTLDRWATEVREPDVFDLGLEGLSYVRVSADPTTALGDGVVTGHRVAVLRGDVDGSWQAVAGSSYVASEHFQLLATELPGVVHLSQFGIVPA
jgi:hypothetical protein